MPNPKRKFSKTRTAKRRTHDNLTTKAIEICPNTNEPHLRHRAYVVDGNLYYKGQMIVENYTSVA